MKSEVCAIFAIGPGGVIGIDDKMPWHSRQDFYHYKQITKGYPCIFGDRTFFGLPKYPLTDRLNIVVKSGIKENSVIQTIIKTEEEPFVLFTGGYIEIQDIETAIQFASNYSKIFICGGRSVYKYCLENEIVDSIYLTSVTSEELFNKVNTDPDRYVYFPINLSEYLKDWDCTEITYSSLPKEDGDISVKFYKYTKNKKA